MIMFNRKIAVIFCVLIFLYAGCDQPPVVQNAPVDSAVGSAEAKKIQEAYQQRQSDFFVEAGGQVVKILADDNDGSRHQRFIVQIEEGHTVLVSHNIDLAPRVEGISAGDTVMFYGEYEWNNKGGVIHWTHHDPQERRPGGWILHEGKRYE